MKMSDNTILITGGTSGIGLELAMQLLNLGNTVIITGRDQAKLDSIKATLPNLHTMLSDVSDPAAIVALYNHVTTDFPALNVLINNAGIMRKINLHDQNDDLASITREIETNLLGTIWMAKQFLPQLKTQKSAAIVNVTSGLAFVPLPISPVYCAAKAGIHSFTQSLRIQLKNTSIQVFELAPPATETPLFKGDFTAADLSVTKNMAVQVLVQQAIRGLSKDVLEIRPGLSNFLKLMSRVAPQWMLKQLGKSTDTMLAQTKT